MATNFITNTASLKTTIADVRKLNAKKIFVGGENILDIINRATPTIAIKHSQDTRTTVTKNDLWGQWVETKADGTIIVHDDWVTNPNSSNSVGWNTSITKVEDNKGYVGDTLYANIQLEKIKDGSSMFSKCSALTSFSSDLPNLTNGSKMFNSCTNLTSFSSDLSSLTTGGSMFNSCTNLNSFSSDLPNLTNGSWMFQNCSKLNSFSSDLPNLTNGNCMFFGCTNLNSFSSDLPNLTNGSNMFSSCTNLTSFSSDLPSLSNGSGMFSSCTNLTSFTSSLNYLITGSSMFNKCKLNSESIMYIVETIKDITAEKQLYIDGTIPYVTSANGVYSAPRGFMSDGNYILTYNNPKLYTAYIPDSYVGKLTLGINVTNDSSTIQQQLEDFAKEATFDSWAELKQAFVDKGWTVTWQYGGTTTSITYDLRGGRVIPCPIYTQLIEVEDKDNAEYTNEDGTKFYNIEWGHEVQNPQEYVQFDSLEDAAISYGVILKG